MPAPAYAMPTLDEIRAERARREERRTQRASRAEDYARWRTDPVAWVNECVVFKAGEELAPYQLESLAALGTTRRASIRGPHGIGKSTTAALAVLWFSTTREGDDWKVVTTASVWRQLEKYLWPEIHKWVGRLRWQRLGREPFTGAELLNLAIKISGGMAFAVASDDATRIEGAQAAHILYVFDEAKAIPAATFDAAEGALMRSNAYALMISTPGLPAGRFYEIQARKPGYEDWWVRHVTLAEAEAAFIKSGGLHGIDPEKAKQRARQWGVESPVYKNRVLGEFADDTAGGIIPLAWIEAANDRWRAWHERTGGVIEGQLDTVGVDVADGGDDLTVLAPRQGEVLVELRCFSSGDTMVTTGRVVGVTTAHGGRAIVDGIGIGSGVMARLRELKIKCAAFIASAGTDVKDRSGELGFVNLRAAGWWGFRERLDPAFSPTLALPPDDTLTGDLVTPRWRVLSGGKIILESKDDIAKRIGRSTDRGDAAVMAFAEHLVEPDTTGRPLVWTWPLLLACLPLW